VISEGQDAVRVQGGLPNAVDQAKWELKLKEFFAEQVNVNVTRKALELKRARECDVQSIAALDSALAIQGKSLRDFYDETLPSRVREGEERKLVHADLLDLPDAAHGGCLLRACVVHRDGLRHVEVDWSTRNKFLGEALDQRGKQWCSMYWLYGRGKVRGVARYDNLHRRHNTWTNAVFAAGFGFKYHEAMIFTSFKKGPWKGASNFGLVKESMEHYLTSQSWSCPILWGC
jgi:hypothetical protein